MVLHEQAAALACPAPTESLYLSLVPLRGQPGERTLYSLCVFPPLLFFPFITYYTMLVPKSGSGHTNPTHNSLSTETHQHSARITLQLVTKQSTMGKVRRNINVPRLFQVIPVL